MSNYGQAALSIVGFAVGTYFGYPQLGFVLGSLAGQAVFPTQLPGVQGPRLQDTRTTTATVGAPVMEVFGTDSISGNVIYTGPIVEVSNTDEVGGKGGPEQDVTTFTYFQTIAVGLCRGPMGGIKQIFENGKLVYDRSPQGDDEGDTDYANRIAATDAYEQTFTLYLGDEEQLPDPTLEAELGIGEVPGYRGLMYVVFPEREMKQSQGLRHPTFKFVVFDEGSLTCEDITDYSSEVMFGWNLLSPDPRSCLNDHRYTADVGSGAVYFDNLDDALNDLLTDTGRTNIDTSIDNIGYSSQRVGPAAPHLVPFSAFPNATTKYLLFNESVSSYIGLSAPNGGVGNGYRLTCATWTFNEFDVGQKVWWCWRNQDYPDPELCTANYGESGLGMLATECVPGTIVPEIPPGWVIDANDCGGSCFSMVLHAPDLRVAVERVARPPDHPCHPRCGTDPPDFAVGSDYCVTNGRILSKSGDWVREEVGYHVLQLYSGGGECDDAVLPVSVARPIGHEDDTQEFWESAYAVAVELGLMEADLEYGVDYPQNTDHGYRLDYSACVVSTEGVSIASIVSRICARVGMTDIDVSDLEDRFVVGYVVSRVMSARDAIEPLRMVGFFDIVDSGPMLRFVARGKPAVRTLDAEDLGARESGGSSQPATSTRKMQDVDLPRQIRLHYRDPARDYEEGEQLSPSRLTTRAVNDVDVECPVAITGTQAKQAVEVMWADLWAGRWVEKFDLGLPHCDLEPADCVLVPIDGRIERVRIVSIDGPLQLRKAEGMRDDSDGYVSVAVADPPVRPPSTIVVYSATDLLLMDLPALRSEDDDAGYYVAARPADPSKSWGGARVYRSFDGGVTFQSELAITNRATTGRLASSLLEGDPSTWDDSLEILVDVVSGSFESRSEADVLDGANAIAVGRHGFWEVLQFANVEQVGPTQVRLSHLLRGRRGTEHLMGTANLTDDVVLVSGPGIVRLPLSDAQIGESHTVKAVTINSSYSTGVDQDFAGAGRALYPFSPVQIAGEFDTAGDLVITWVRRDRLGQELQDGVEIPMSDPPQSYEVDVYTLDSPPQLLRTLESSSEQVVYDAADLATDAGSPVPSELLVRVYQISTVVGRGTPGEAIVGGT